MAKRRSVMVEHHATEKVLPKSGRQSAGGISFFATTLLGAAMVYLTYYPSDSVLVEQGDALWLALLALTIALLTALCRTPWFHGGQAESDSNLGVLLDVTAWSLGGWMMLAAFATSPPGNLRMATNEAWLWIAAAALFTSVRWLARSIPVQRSIAMLIVICATGLAVVAMHQHWVTLPLNRAAFAEDPDRVLEAAGYDAPQGTAERAIFAGRLMDGGPTGTFALANSLAAVLIAGLVLSSGLIRTQWRSLSYLQAAGWCTLVTLCGAALIATGSRSAIVATLVGVAAILLVVATADRGLTRQTKIAMATATAVLALLGSGLLIGSGRFLGSASTTILFRLQYWQSTWLMTLDHPLFGAGPGNFQSIYERYRLPTAAEQIAEPHNLLFETMASGGLVGAGLLIVGVAVGICYANQDRSAEPIPSETSPKFQDPAIWIGAIVTLLLIWIVGLATLRLPEVDPNLFAIPVVLALGLILVPTATSIDGRTLKQVFTVTAAAVSLHLVVSGGMTVPGVAVLVWIAGGIATSIVRWHAPSSRSAQRIPALVAGGCLALAAVLYWMSLQPVESARRRMEIAALEIENGRSAKARRLLLEATQADRWSPAAPIALADLYRWRLMAADRQPDRRDWESLLQEAKQRGGDDPALYRAIGIQQLHLFQRHGNPDDLLAASNTFAKAVEWSPANQWLMAQLASIVATEGDLKRASELATSAEHLSELGINAERRYSFQRIYPAIHLGAKVEQRPLRRAAQLALAEQGVESRRDSSHPADADHAIVEPPNPDS